jgi:tetratricopeptide (TPR) repeat protein
MRLLHLSATKVRSQMKRRRWWGMTAAVAVVMLLAGALGPLRQRVFGEKVPASSVSAETLSPAGGARSIDATIASLQVRLRANPDDPRSAAQLGLAYLQKGRISLNPIYFPKAEALLRRALHGDNRNFDAMVGLGLVANARHRFGRGLDWGRRASTVNPYGAAARGVIVDALIELGRYAAAADELQEMVDLRPDLSSFSRVSYLRELHGNTRGALAAMRMALDSIPELGEDSSWVRTQIGDLHFGVGDVSGAGEWYDSAVQVAPGYYLPKVGRARVAAARGDLHRAIRMMSGVVDSYPSPQNVIFLGDLLTAAGRADDARRTYRLVEVQRRLFASNGVIPDVELTYFYADHARQPRRTVALARTQYRRRPSIRTADALAWALHVGGRDQEAQRYAAKALKLGTKDALLLFHAGAIAFANGKDDDARALLRASVDTNPHFSLLHAPEAKSLVAELSR